VDVPSAVVPAIDAAAFKFQKDLAFLRSWMLGKEWWLACRALEFALSHHTGLRKDAITPEAHHQVQIALNARTLLPHLLEPETTLVVIFTHDLCEDYDISYSEIEKRFGARASAATERITKKYKGVEKPYDFYFADMEQDPVASIAKGLDRCHNVWTMAGAFSHEKIAAYADEIDRWFLPMLKKARKRFPEQEPAYQNIAHQLRSMRDIYRWALSSPDG
jgi:(p)ppGpp synthase/HD superfamily hydrolase